MNWYNIHKTAQYGEFWLIDGRAEFCDGEVCDENHATIVKNHILSNHDLDYDTYLETDMETLREKGMTDEEFAVLSGKEDAREYGLKHLGWIRVKGDSCEVNGLSPEVLRNLANGLWDAYQDGAEEKTYEIHDAKSRNFFTDVPWSVISNENLQEFFKYKYVYGTASGSKKKVTSQAEKFWIYDGYPQRTGSHSTNVAELFLYVNHDITLEQFKQMTPEQKNQIGLSQDEAAVLNNEMDPIEYGIRNLGWARVNGRSCEINEISVKDLKNLADGLYREYKDRVANMLFEIEDLKTRRLFVNVPWEIIKYQDIRSLLQYENRYRMAGA